MAYQDIFTALADPTRRSIFESLQPSPKSVSELARSQPVSRPAVSQHLRVLADANLVKAEAIGNSRIYSIKAEGLEELREYVNKFWNDALAAYSSEIERQFGAKKENS